MKYRHWQRITKLTGYEFDLEKAGLSLKDIMEAPLLEHKEDIEDVCISAMKEKDIEAKLKGVVTEWSAQELEFLTFKNRGELMLRGGHNSRICKPGRRQSHDPWIFAIKQIQCSFQKANPEMGSGSL